MTTTASDSWRTFARADTSDLQLLAGREPTGRLTQTIVMNVTLSKGTISRQPRGHQTATNTGFELRAAREQESSGLIAASTSIEGNSSDGSTRQRRPLTRVMCRKAGDWQNAEAPL